MRTKRRATCPLCGLMADLDRFKAEHYPIRVVIQTFGGKVSHKEFGSSPQDTVGKGRGSNPGRIEYEDITETKEGRDIIKMIRSKLS